MSAHHLPPQRSDLGDSQFAEESKAGSAPKCRLRVCVGPARRPHSHLLLTNEAIISVMVAHGTEGKNFKIPFAEVATFSSWLGTAK